MNSAEYYDPKTNQWTIIAPMRHRRSGVGVVAYHNSIYVLFVITIHLLILLKRLFLPRGGFNGTTRMNSGERYNPKTNMWMTIPDMYNPRSNFAVEVDEKISKLSHSINCL